MALALLSVVSVLAVLAVAALAVALVRTRRASAAAAAGSAAVAHATAHAAARVVADAALQELREHAAAERDHAVRAALEHAAVLGREQVGAAAGAGANDLAARHHAIDRQLAQVQAEVKTDLARLGELVHQVHRASLQSFGSVEAQLRVQAESTAALAATAQGLREALASPKARGQWGERMAEDVLRVAGFVEHVNYEKQTQAEGSRGIPDFTFRLPKGHVLYMDVKFPLTAYLRYLDATNEPERATARAAFVRDVEAKVRELADRGYADRSRRTLDQVLLFIPNESIAAVVHEWAPTLVDGALARNVVLCSPLTLFTMLGVIRQAADAFMVEQTSDEILRLVGAFDKQWQKFGDALDLLGKRIDSAQKAFEELNGTRRRQLERPVGQMEQLRAQRGLAADPLLSPGADVRELSEVRPA